jgi:ABC-2 type transport system ATP-binding protein
MSHGAASRPGSGNVSARPVIELRDLTKHYGETIGVEGIDLDVEAGEIFGFLGPNGAGKTTTIRLLLDLIRPTRGTVRVFGRSASEPRLRSRVGYLPGELVLDGRLTGAATLRFLDALRQGAVGATRRQRRRELCERLGLPDGDLARRVRDYSRGMKQKLGLVAALQHDPDLLVLDEPTTGLDPLVRETVFEILVEAGRAGKTVFHSSHVLSEVDRTCTRAAIVGAGRLLDVMRVADVRRTSVRRMVVRFAGKAPIGELDLPGVEVVEHTGRRVVLKVASDLDPLLGVLARHPVEHLVVPEPSLEEAFVELYRAVPGSGS